MPSAMRNMNGAEYGHMHLSLFYQKIVVLEDRGLIFKGKYYPWGSIRTIEVWEEPWPGWGYVPDAKLLPRARVSLSDGQSFLLRGDALVKRGGSLSAGFSDAFDELVSNLQEMRRGEMHNSRQTPA